MFEPVVDFSGRAFKVGEVNMDSCTVTSEKYRAVRDYMISNGYDAMVMPEFEYLVRDEIEFIEKDDVSEVEINSQDSGSDSENSIGSEIDREERIKFDSNGLRAVRNPDHTLWYRNGIGVLLTAQLAAEVDNVEKFIFSSPRIISFAFSDFSLTAYYAPAKHDAADKFNELMIAHVSSFKARKVSKLKTHIAIGDSNSETKGDKRNGGYTLGDYGVKMTARGRKWVKVCKNLDWVVLNSYFNWDIRHTFARGDSKTEIDHVLIRHCYKKYIDAFNIVDLSALIPVRKYKKSGKERKLNFGHRSLLLQFAVPNFNGRVKEAREKQENSKVYTANPDPNFVTALNMALLDSTVATIDDFVRVLVEHSKNFLTLPSFKDIGIEQHDDIEKDQALSNMDGIFKQFRTHTNYNMTKVKDITDAQGADQLKSVSDRVRKDAVINEAIFEFLSELAVNSEELDELSKPIEIKELQNVYGLLPKAGASDALGLKLRVFGYLSPQSELKLIKFFNEGFDSGDFISWGENSVLVKVTALWKKKGSRRDPNTYRFICVCTCVIKLFEKILERRLVILADKKGWLCEYNFGFRMGIGCSDAILLFWRLWEDLVKYAGSQNLAKVGLRQLDMEKAFPSAQWSLVGFLMSKVGVAPSRFWSALRWVHRSSIYVLGDEKFSLSQGFKEGGCSSPPLYNSLFICFHGISSFAGSKRS